VTASFVGFALAPTRARGFATGVVGALAALVRPTGIVPLAGLVIGWVLLRRGATGARPGALWAMALGAALTLLPWTLGTAAAFHAFIPVSTGGGEVFYMSSTAETDGRWDPARWPELSGAVLSREEQRLGHPLDPLERDRALMRAGIANWKRAPITSLT